jgi:hypothetical protein
MSIRIRDLPGSLVKRSGDPNHPDNALDADWQGGYLFGCFSTNDSMDDIHDEWHRRGCPELVKCPDSDPPTTVNRFRSWKDGYWAGKFYAL